MRLVKAKTHLQRGEYTLLSLNIFEGVVVRSQSIIQLCDVGYGFSALDPIGLGIFLILL